MNDPFAVFSRWFAEAEQAGVPSLDVVALASATREGRPSVRMVLYRGMREGGFSFFTSYASRKGVELIENPFGAMAFYWQSLGKQVRIEGAVERLSSTESDSYFHSRPLDSQITSAVSRQSQPLIDEAGFIAEIAAAEASAGGKPVARPDHWGGFKLMPSSFEFWIHQEHRRHHRMLYSREGTIWTATRLYP
jgi:pyridoxamine 5'-phosphate oxidase